LNRRAAAQNVDYLWSFKQQKIKCGVGPLEAKGGSGWKLTSPRSD